MTQKPVEPSRREPPSFIPDAASLARWTAILREYEEQGREALARNPLESLLALVTGGALVYYLAERGHNDKVRTYWDALEYISTSASVGYSNIFPATPLGKLAASVLFVLGPTLAAQALDPPKRKPADRSGASPGDRAVIDKLEQILAELRKLNEKQGHVADARIPASL